MMNIRDELRTFSRFLRRRAASWCMDWIRISDDGVAGILCKIPAKSKKRISMANDAKIDAINAAAAHATNASVQQEAM